MMSVIERIADWLCPDDPEEVELAAWLTDELARDERARTYLQKADAAALGADDESLPDELRQNLREQQGLCLQIARLILNA